MKKNLIRKSVSFMLCVALIGAMFSVLSGCGGKSGETEMAIVSAHRQNSASVNPDSAWLKDEILKVVECYGKLTYVSVEGEPRQVGSVAFTPPKDVFQLPSITRKNNLKQLDNAVALLGKVQARTPEADVLEAVRCAVKSFSDTATDKRIVICDSMLGTTGEASFAQGYFLNADPAVIVAQLEKNRAIPDLTGIDVVFCVTKTADSQSALSMKEQATLADIWTAVFEAGNCKSVRCVEKDLTHETEHDKLPAVSAVTTIPSEGLDGTEFDTVAIFDETKLSFLPDTTEFVDPASAKEALLPIVKAMQQDKNLTIVIGGTTATVLSSSDKCRGFSLKRAKAVRSAMLEMDKTLSKRIQVRGLGYENDFHTPDLVDGKLVEAEAQKNRLVIIATQESEIGKQILG